MMNNNYCSNSIKLEYVNDVSVPLNLSMNKRGLTTKSRPLESKVKNVLERLRVRIKKGPPDKIIKKTVKNCATDQKVMVNPTLPVMKTQPVRKKVLDVKVRNVIDRLRVGIIKDLNVKEPLDLTNIKKEVSNEPLNPNIKLEFEEEYTLDLDIVKHEPILEKNAVVVSRKKKTVLIPSECEPGVENIADKHEKDIQYLRSSEKESSQNNMTPQVTIVNSDCKLIENKSYVPEVNGLNNNKLVLNCENMAPCSVDVVNNDLNENSTLTLCNSAINKLVSQNKVVKKLFKKKSRKKKKKSREKVVKELSRTVDSSVNSIESIAVNLKEKVEMCVNSNSIKDVGSELVNEKLCHNDIPEANLDSDHAKVNKNDLSESNNSRSNDSVEKNSLVIKIVRKKGSKKNKLEVQMVEKRGVDNNTKNNVENKSDSKTKKGDDSFADETLKLLGPDNVTSPSSLSVIENNTTSKKEDVEDNEIVPTDVLQTEILHSIYCMLCKITVMVPVNENTSRSDLYLCKSCENLLHKDLQKNEKVLNSFNISNVTCFKCNLSFSSEEEIESHYKTHKDNDNRNLTQSQIKKQTKPQKCRECSSNNITNVTGKLCVHLRNRRHKCVHCGKLFSTNGDLKKHINIHTREVSYECKVCKKTFYNRSNLRKHAEIHNGNRERQFKCEYCDKSFYKLDHLKVHVNVHTSEKLYECPYCDKTFTRKYCLQLHINIHTLEKLFECTICKKICMDRSTLRKHMAIHSDDSPFKCGYCDKSFKQKNQLDSHTNNHTLDNLYFCDHCNKSFKNKTVLRKHMEIHLGTKENYLCIICNKSYSSRNNLCVHMNRHTHIKSYDCKYCSKSFDDPSSLGKHVNIHTKEKKFHCADCNKIFYRKSHLRSHVNSHLGMKPYPCKLCNKYFTQKAYLKIHVDNTHKGLKRFTCTKCNKKFKTKTNLDVHMNTHTREKLFPCKFCKKICTQKGNLKRHLCKYHPNKTDGNLKL